MAQLQLLCSHLASRCKAKAAEAIERMMPVAQKKEVVGRRRPFDVFINHRGADTRRTVASLLYDRLVQLNLRPFLDVRAMQPGDKLYEGINAGIRQCKVGVAIFSPNYCNSSFCLHELAMLVETKKKLLPIFCDVKPSELVLQAAAAAVKSHSPEHLSRYWMALHEAKNTVGLTFDSNNGNLSELVTKTADLVLNFHKGEKRS